MKNHKNLLIAFLSTFLTSFALLITAGVMDNLALLVTGSVMLALVATPLLILLTNVQYEERLSYLRGE